MKKVLVLLSTYNGERYLREQLDSLYAQEGVEVHILVRDDGSQDNTPSLLEEYSTNKEHITVLLKDNIGASLSFYELIKTASNLSQQYDYYSFCDQDDIWDKDKLSSAVELLENNNSNELQLYYCGFKLIDGEGNDIIFPANDEKITNYKTVIFRNPVLGCSMVFNQKLLKCSSLILNYIDSPSFKKEYLFLHDAWVLQVAYLLDAKIIHDTRPHFSYRQHGKNVTSYTESSIIKRMKAVKRRMKAIPNKYSINACIMRDILDVYLNNEKKMFLNEVATYRESLIKTIRFAFRYSSLFNVRYVQLYALTIILLRKF